MLRRNFHNTFFESSFFSEVAGWVWRCTSFLLSPETMQVMKKRCKAKSPNESEQKYNALLTKKKRNRKTEKRNREAAGNKQGDLCDRFVRSTQSDALCRFLKVYFWQDDQKICIKWEMLWHRARIWNGKPLQGRVAIYKDEMERGPWLDQCFFAVGFRGACDKTVELGTRGRVVSVFWIFDLIRKKSLRSSSPLHFSLRLLRRI